jgi:hypothetical protein
MSAGVQHKLRIPLLSLAAADLAILAARLRPWQKIASLPGNGSVGFDPGIVLLAYVGIVLWLTGRTGHRLVNAQSAVTLLGLLGGALLAARAWLEGLASALHTTEVQGVLMIAAVICWGVAGTRAARAAGSAGGSFISGIWSAMVSCMLACTVVLGQFYISGLPPDTQDSYKQFQEIGIGSDATVALVHSLNTTTSLLLVAPIAGATVALLFGWIAQRRRTKGAELDRNEGRRSG